MMKSTRDFPRQHGNIIKLNDDFMDITRRGVSNVHMMFEKTGRM